MIRKVRIKGFLKEAILVILGLSLELWAKIKIWFAFPVSNDKNKNTVLYISLSVKRVFASRK